MKKASNFLMYFIRVTAILLIAINLFRLFEKLEYFSFIQPPKQALFNSFLLLVFGYFRQILLYFKVKMSDLLYLLAAISVILTFQIGMIFGVYQTLPGYDSFAHFANGGLLILVGIMFMSIYFKNGKMKELSPAFIVIFAFSFASMLGVIWEIYEYTIDAVGGFNMQRYKDLETGVLFIGQEALRDTMKDLILNTFGSLLAAILIYIDLKKDSPYINKMFVQRIENNVDVIEQDMV